MVSALRARFFENQGSKNKLTDLKEKIFFVIKSYYFITNDLKTKCFLKKIEEKI
jgi:hypothetical protein